MKPRQLRRDILANNTDNSPSKETRWDRIRKRCTGGDQGSSTFPLKTDAVRRFIDMDFIGKRQTNMLHGEQNLQLNPALVMDLRHEMFQKIPRKLPLATVENQKNLQACRAHNIAVEERYIDIELNRFRQQLEKSRKRNEIKFPKETEKHNSLYLDNQSLMRSLEASSKHIKDFYAAPLEALDEVELLCDSKEYELLDECIEDGLLQLVENGVVDAVENFVTKAAEDSDTHDSMMLETTPTHEAELQEFLQAVDEDDALLAETIDYEVQCRMGQFGAVQSANDGTLEEFVRRTPSPLTPTDEFLKPMREAAARQQAEVRRVRFEDEIALQKYERENSSCSNTSDGLDSIISDLAEEALLELQMEEEGENFVVKCVHSDELMAVETQLDIEAQNAVEETKENAIPAWEAPTGEVTPTQNVEIEPLLITQMRLPPRRNENNGSKNEVLPTSSSDDEESVSNHEQNLIIEQLFQQRAQTNTVLLRKYFLRWIHYTTIEKIERQSLHRKTNRIQQINAFLDKIRKEKVRISKVTNEAAVTGDTTKSQLQQPGNVQISKKYQNKIKQQQDIIDMQRLKLERQERMIMELKLKKLSDEAKEARQELKNELKSVIRSGDEKVKAKAKCLQLIGNLRDAEDEDDFKRLQGKALLMPKFLQKMEERAMERSIRHEQARQRRLQQEAEREALKIAAEEAKRLEDEEAKRMRIEALKEKRRQEKMAKVLRERERQRAIENNRKAQAFCRRRLLRRIGMESFKRLIQRKRENARRCEALRRKVIKRAYFLAWRDYYYFELSRRQQKAEDFHCILVKRQALVAWIFYAAEERSKYYVAIDWYDMKLSSYMFQEWAAYTKRMKQIEQTKMRKAVSHYEWNLKFKVLDCWQRLPQILQLDKETEQRRQRWRMKIWELLPDYTPRLDAFV